MKQKAIVTIKWQHVSGADISAAQSLRVVQQCEGEIREALETCFAADPQVLIDVTLRTDGRQIRVADSQHSRDGLVYEETRDCLRPLIGLRAAGLTVE